MLFQFRLAISLFAIGLISVSVSAEPMSLEYSSLVTLSSLSQNVYEHHPARQAQSAYQQQIDANTALANATFADASSVSLNHYNDVIGSSDGFQEWEGSIDMPLWLSGQKQQQAILSDKMSAELTAYQQQLRLKISAQIRESVWRVVLADTASKQAYQTWQMALKLERDVDAHIKAGELAGSELLLANSHVLKTHSDYVLAQDELKYVLKNFQQLTAERALPQKHEELLAVNTTITNEHPSLISLDQKINTLRTKQDIAHYQDAVNPSLSVGVRRERNDSKESFNHSLGLGISFALDDDVYRRPAITNAARILADAEVERQQLKRKLQIELATQLHQLAIMKQQLTMAVEHSETTEQYLSIQQHAFDLGEINVLNLLTSQVLANKSVNRKQSLEISVKHAIAKVNQALGIIL
ncbi:MAG: TolC family protein [Piscirickettsiaceae bacterium]|nr:TolC family protein [Piscirickettsiaceae bacterium]